MTWLHEAHVDMMDVVLQAFPRETFLQRCPRHSFGAVPAGALVCDCDERANELPAAIPTLVRFALVPSRNVYLRRRWCFVRSLSFVYFFP